MAALPHRARARTDAEEVTSGRALRFGGVPAACVLLALAFRDGIGVPLLLLGAVISAGAAWVTTVGARVRPPREQLAWRWFRRASWAVVLGFSLEVLVVALTGGVATPGSSGAFAAGTIAVVAMLYQAVQHWNRTRTDDEDSGEWLAGLGAAFAAAAVLMYVASRGAGPHASGWHADGHALRAAVVVVLLCTVVTIIPTANLLPDWRAWTLVGLVTVVVGFELVSYVAVVTGGGHHDHQMAGVVCGWVVLTLMIAFASTTAPVVRRRADVSPTASTVGAIVVVVVAVATIVVDALAPSGRADVALLSALGALAGTLRLAYMVRDYAALSVAQRESRTDGLTGVPNRRAFIERLERRLSRHREVSLMMIDLDEFKAVNDDRGHAAGDELMRTVAARMAAALTADGMLARIGGDEFAVLLDGHDHELAQRTARSVLEAVRTPVMIDGEPVRIDASIGLVSTRHRSATVEELLRAADHAMYTAKRAGVGITVFDERVAADADRRVGLLRDLRTLLTTSSRAAGELVVHYQPQVSCEDRAVVGVEALVRWQHPRLGLLAPAEFLDLAERYQLMPHLTQRVLARAVQDASGWLRMGRRMPVSVNLSASCLTHSSLLPTLEDALRESRLPPGLLTLEVTETAIMDDPRKAVESLAALTACGVHVSIDDYGTGHSTLAYLNHLPARELKLDQSFTSRLLADERTSTIVAGTVELAHRLGLRVTAEGVEDDETHRALAALGCDRTQGFLHSRPLPILELDAWVDEWHSLARAGRRGS